MRHLNRNNGLSYCKPDPCLTKFLYTLMYSSNACWHGCSVTQQRQELELLQYPEWNQSPNHSHLFKKVERGWKVLLVILCVINRYDHFNNKQRDHNEYRRPYSIHSIALNPRKVWEAWVYLTHAQHPVLLLKIIVVSNLKFISDRKQFKILPGTIQCFIVYKFWHVVIKKRLTT